MGNYRRNMECPKCGSSNALGVYVSDDGEDRTNATCFKCQHYIHNVEESPIMENNLAEKKQPYFQKLTRQDVEKLPTAYIKHRKVAESVYAHFGVKMSVNQTTGEPETVYYPYYIKDQLAGYKVRELPKEWKLAVGSISGVGFFGQQLCHGGKNLYITEGEEDALAVYHVLRYYFQTKTSNTDYMPSVVSIPNGAKGLKSICKNEKKFLSTYQNIIYIPDNDEEGEKSLQQAYLLLKDRLKLVRLSEKDSSDMLQAKEGKELLNSLLNPEKYTPGSLLTFGQILDQCTLEPEYEFCRPYPEFCKDLNFKTGGRRFGDLDMLIAGTGCGKSSFMREMVLADLMRESSDKVGALFLEESAQRFGDSMISVAASTRFGLDGNKDKHPELFIKTKSDLKEKFDNKLMALDHFGSTDDVSFKEKLEYMAEEFGAKWIYIDHLSMLLGDCKGSSDMLTKTDAIIDYLAKFVVKYNVWVLLAAHLRKTFANSGNHKYEKGFIPDLDDLKGSGSSKQMAFQVLALQRNLYHSDPTLRNVVALHVLKNRYSGRTGAADFLKMDEETGRFERTKKPDVPLLEKDNQEELEI